MVNVYGPKNVRPQRERVCGHKTKAFAGFQGSPRRNAEELVEAPAQFERSREEGQLEEEARQREKSKPLLP